MEVSAAVTDIIVSPADYAEPRILLTPGGFDASLRPEHAREVTTIWLVDTEEAFEAAAAINAEEQRRRDEAYAAYPPILTDNLDPSLLALLTPEQIDELTALATTVTAEELWGVMDAMINFDAAHRMSWTWAESRQERMDARGGDDVLTSPAVAGTLVAALLLAEVALVAGAAYATGTRRRLWEIGLMTANGATDRHVRLVVVGEGLVAGVLGASIGIVLGLTTLVLGASILQRFTSQLVAGVPVTVVDVAAPAAAGVLAAAAAAWLPARTASVVPTTTALQGRMPVSAPRRWILPVGAGLTGLGAFLLIVARTALGDAATAQAGLGVVLMIGGFALLTGPMVAWAGRFADRFRATARLVLRDSSRQRTRAAAAIAAMMVVLLAPVVAGASFATQQERDLIYGLPDPRNQVMIEASDPLGRSIDVTEEDVARVHRVIPGAETVWIEALGKRVVFGTGGDGDPLAADPLGDASGAMAIGTETLAMALDSPAIATHLAAGTPVVLGVEDRPTEVTVDGTSFTARELPVPVIWAVPRLLVPEAMAADHGWQRSGDRALFVVDHRLTDAEAYALWDLEGLSVYVTPGGLLSSPQWMLVGLAATLVVVLVITAMVTALSAAESNQDLVVMTAVGAPPSMRRRFLGLQTGYYTVFAAVLAVPLGLLLLKVTTGSQEWTHRGPFGSQPADALVIPWVLIALLMLVFPVIVGGLTALTVRSSPTVPPRRAT